MSNESITYSVVGLCGLLIVIAWAALLVAPAWQSYSRIWERLAASFLTLFVLGTLLGAGIGVGAAVVYYWDRIAA